MVWIIELVKAIIRGNTGSRSWHIARRILSIYYQLRVKGIFWVWPAWFMTVIVPWIQRTRNDKAVIQRSMEIHVGLRKFSAHLSSSLYAQHIGTLFFMFRKDAVLFVLRGYRSAATPQVPRRISGDKKRPDSISATFNYDEHKSGRKRIRLFSVTRCAATSNVCIALWSKSKHY